MQLSRLICAVLLGATLLVATISAHAQSWPSKPIRFIIPQTPSGQVDTVGRSVMQQLSERLGQPVVVENRAGANGAIAHEGVARAAPDGHTLLMVSQSAMVMNPVMRKSLPYDPLKDFTPISMLFETPFYLIVHPTVPVKSMQELVTLAKSQPGKLHFATAGTGNSQHLYVEILKSRSGMDLTHVPYKGSAQAGTDMLTGIVQVMLQGSGFTVPQAKAGKVRVLASSGGRRTHAMPEVPTIAEAGVPGYVASTWYGLAGPAQLPRTIHDRLIQDVTEILRMPALVDKFGAQDIILSPTTPEQLMERVRTELPLFAKAARAAGIEPD